MNNAISVLGGRTLGGLLRRQQLGGRPRGSGCGIYTRPSLAETPPLIIFH